MNTEVGWNWRADSASTSTGEAATETAIAPSLLYSAIGRLPSAGVVGGCLCR